MTTEEAILNYRERVATSLMTLKRLGLIASALFLIISTLIGQQLEPRVLSAAPVNTNFVLGVYGLSTGNILLDNSLPVEDLKAVVNTFTVGYGTTFKLFNRLSRFDVVVPTSVVKLKALVEGVDTSANRNGLGDPQFRLSMILVGVKPVSISEFANTTHGKFRLGAQFAIRPPLGKYKDSQLINLGTNRWAFKMGLTAAYIFASKFVTEVQLNGWAFSQNNSFLETSTLKQEFLLSYQFHFTYIFNKKMWAALSLGANTLGETRLDGVEQKNHQEGVRSGFAFAYRIKPKHSLKFAFTNALIARQGADFLTFVIGYQYLWFRK